MLAATAYLKFFPSSPEGLDHKDVVQFHRSFEGEPNTLAMFAIEDLFLTRSTGFEPAWKVFFF